MRPLFLKLPLPNLSLSTLLRLSESRRDGIISSPLSESYADDLYLRLDGSNKMLGDLVLGDGVVSNNILPNENWDAKQHYLGSSAKRFYGMYTNFLSSISNYSTNFMFRSVNSYIQPEWLVEANMIFRGYTGGAYTEVGRIKSALLEWEISRAGDVTHRLDSQGTILTDRTTATKYRLLVDNGVLDIEVA